MKITLQEIRAEWGFYRWIFWPLFVALSLAIGLYFWKQKIPVRVQTYIRKMHHPNARIAGNAWIELQNLALNDAQAFSLLLRDLDDSGALSFLIERTPKGDFFVVRGRPIYFKTERVYCESVGEALAALAYNQHQWRTDYQGSWPSWWYKNRKYYRQP